MKLIPWIFSLLSQKQSKLPLVVICGATGTGKSKLAVEIAKHYNGEIINADALQIYKGMDIATNKIPIEEQCGVAHHLMGFKDIDTIDYSIHDFQKAALNEIMTLKCQNKMPILVGGTNYYIESVLWHKLVDVSGPGFDATVYDNLQLHKYLLSLDPQTASLIHPNARRKVLRAIEISRNSPLNRHEHCQKQPTWRRFPLNETVFIWLNSNPEYLFPRLDKRVDSMLANGLLTELSKLSTKFIGVGRGVFQAIGIKEFRDYIELDDKESAAGRRLLARCVERLKLSNKQYVRVQNKWIRNRFLRSQGALRDIPLFKIDVDDGARCGETVLARSLAIIEAVRRCDAETHYDAFVRQLTVIAEPLSAPRSVTPCYNVCEPCNIVCITVEIWRAHVTGARHRRMLERLGRTNNEDLV